MLRIRRAVALDSVVGTISALSACGGGGGGSNSQAGASTSAASIVPTDDQIRADIATSQASSTGIPIWDTSDTYTASPLVNPYKGSVSGTYSIRWYIERDGLIPVIDLTGRAETTTALNNLEAAVGKKLFNRLPSTTSTTTFERGVIINNATPPQQGSGQENNCGSLYANRSNFSSEFVDPTYVLDPPLNSSWQAAVDGNQVLNPRPTYNIDVDFSNNNCAPFEPLAEHELVHALGLAAHFDGFGEGGGNCNGALCTDRTYPVLKPLYANPPMTQISAMTVSR